MGRNTAHELGHKAGLDHPWRGRSASDVRTATNEYQNNFKRIPVELRETVRDNIMNSHENVVKQLKSVEGKRLTPGQEKVMQNIIEKEQKLNLEQNQNNSNGIRNPNAGYGQ